MHELAIFGRMLKIYNSGWLWVRIRVEERLTFHCIYPWYCLMFNMYWNNIWNWFKNSVVPKLFRHYGFLDDNYDISYRCSHTKYCIIFYSNKLEFRIFYFKFAQYKSFDLLKEKDGLGGLFVLLNSKFLSAKKIEIWWTHCYLWTQNVEWDLAVTNFFPSQISFSLVHTMHSFIS